MKTFSGFPRFNGENPEMWIEKCHKSFLDNPKEDNEKVLMAARHMDGLADKWYKNHIEGTMDKYVTMDEYVKQFEQLRSAMISSHYEKYLLNLFVSGLREEISLMVDMVAPLTLDKLFA
ncbi:hypothetical protein CDL12_27681 [Handroanthus impetiginosus]|uniref:Retrotransposon gag domain-containing protein n=1 Tax=Handroanthus impetiginosus TaxID=429701 RepID=A0A2G9G3E8_9LAMI|nr:hypothetical protein CDL12_27681 [Handroanthus impetiginosus]